MNQDPTPTPRTVRALELRELARIERLHSLAYIPAEQRARVARDAALERMQANRYDPSAIFAFRTAQSWHTGAAANVAATRLNAEEAEARATQAEQWAAEET